MRHRKSRGARGQDTPDRCPGGDRVTIRRLSMVFGLLLVSYYALSFFYASHIQVNEGLGWDGSRYTLGASRLFDRVFGAEASSGANIGLTDYRMKRLLPSFILYGVGRLLGLDLKQPLVWRALFYVYNSVLLLLLLAVTDGIARTLGMSWRKYALLLVGLFVTFANLRFMTYYPTLGDTTAFFLGALAFYFHLLKRPGWLFAVLLAGLWTWPVAWLFGGLLLIYPRQDPFPEQPAGARYVYVCYGIFLAGAMYLWFVYTQNPEVLVSIDNVLLALGIAVAYISYYVAYLPSLRAKRFISEVRWPYLAALVALVLVYNVSCARLFAHYDVPTHPITLMKALSSTLRLSILFPGAFLVQQFLYFGPAFLLLMLYFPKIVRTEVRSPGVLLSLLLAVFMGLNIETRLVLFQVPMIVFLAVSALDDDTIDWRTLVVFTVASLFAARLFLPLDIPPEALTEASRAGFPQQFYWSISYSLAPSGYYLNLLTALPVVLPVLIERLVRGGFLLRKRECTQASGS